MQNQSMAKISNLLISWTLRVSVILPCLTLHPGIIYHYGDDGNRDLSSTSRALVPQGKEEDEDVIAKRRRSVGSNGSGRGGVLIRNVLMEL